MNPDDSFGIFIKKSSFSDENDPVEIKLIFEKGGVFFIMDNEKIKIDNNSLFEIKNRLVDLVHDFTPLKNYHENDIFISKKPDPLDFLKDAKLISYD